MSGVLTSRFITLGEVATHFGCQLWQVRRLYERGILPPAPRVGTIRVVQVSDLPVIGEALEQAGYIPTRKRT
jgi:hypothetical protein